MSRRELELKSIGVSIDVTKSANRETSWQGARGARSDAGRIRGGLNKMLFSGGQIMAEMSPQTVPVGYESDSATYGGDVGDSQVPSPSNAYSSGLASFDILDFSSLVAADDWGQTPTKFPTSALFDMKPISEIKREAGLPSPPCSGHIAPIPATSTIKMEDALVPELSLAQVHSLALEQVKRDIHETCDALQIASDPFFWSVEDVRAWINLTLRHYHLPAIPLEYFNMDGSMLCSLSEEEFRQRAALGGDTLYAQLDIWKTACASSNGPGVSFRPEESVPDIGVYSRQWGIGTPSCPSPASSHTSSVASPSPPDLPPPNSECSSEGGSAFHSDDENDDGCDIDKPTRTGGGGASHSHIHLWQFLKELLTQPHLYGSCIRWLDRAKGVYKIEDSVRVARLWGRRKNRPAMNYDKLSRSIRQYYKKGIMKKTERSQRLVYQFCHPYCL